MRRLGIPHLRQLGSVEIKSAAVPHASLELQLEQRLREHGASHESYEQCQCMRCWASVAHDVVLRSRQRDRRRRVERLRVDILGLIAGQHLQARARTSGGSKLRPSARAHRAQIAVTYRADEHALASAAIRVAHSGMRGEPVGACNARVRGLCHSSLELGAYWCCGARKQGGRWKAARAC